MQCATSVFSALADPIRLRSLAPIVQEGELCVCELIAALDLPQPKISRHLAVMRDAGLLRDRRDAQWVLYASMMGRDAWWSVPAAVLIGIPMYSNAAGIIPVVEALIGKGAALGTVLAFMMSVIALSLPEMIILRKVLTLKLIAVFVGVVASGILAVGFLFNALFQ
jgi:DNA-binding transcriptional ArsR family regulator